MVCLGSRDKVIFKEKFWITLSERDFHAIFPREPNQRFLEINARFNVEDLCHFYAMVPVLGESCSSISMLLSITSPADVFAPVYGVQHGFQSTGVNFVCLAVCVIISGNIDGSGSAGIVLCACLS